MDNFDYIKYLKNNPLLSEIKINNPTGKLKVRDNGSSAYVYFYDKDNLNFPIKFSPGQNYFRRYKDYITIYFVDQMNDGEPIENYKEEIEKTENWLKSKRIKYKKFEKTYQQGYNTTRLNIPLDKVEILPGEDIEDGEEY